MCFYLKDNQHSNACQHVLPIQSTYLKIPITQQPGILPQVPAIYFTFLFLGGISENAPRFGDRASPDRQIHSRSTSNWNHKHPRTTQTKWKYISWTFRQSHDYISASHPLPKVSASGLRGPPASGRVGGTFRVEGYDSTQPKLMSEFAHTPDREKGRPLGTTQPSAKQSGVESVGSCIGRKHAFAFHEHAFAFQQHGSQKAA
jgi:hypothetical protein